MPSVMSELPDLTYVNQISSVSNKFADGFNGTALDSSKWNVVRNTGTGQTITVSGGNLTIATGTVSGNEVLLVSRQMTTIPTNLMFVMNMSQRIVNQDIRIGLLEVDANGDPINHSTLPLTTFRNATDILFNGAVNTTATVETMSTNAAAIKTVALTTTATSANQDFYIEARAEDISFGTQATDSATAKSTNGARISSQCPAPDKRYAAFIWVRNTGTAASSTNVIVARVVQIDLEELQVEAVGRGSNLPSQSIMTTSTGTVTVGALATGTNTIGNVNLANDVASATSNATTISTVTAAATTNATSVKATAGKIVGGTVFNTTAAAKYLKLYNKASAPVVGTDTPVFQIQIPANGSFSFGGAFDHYGMYFSTGIAYAITGAVGTADTTATAVNDVVGAIAFV